MPKVNIKLHTVILDPSIRNYPYLLGDIVQTADTDEAGKVCFLSGTETHTNGNYFEAEVLLAPNGEKQRILLNHSFVVAILENLNLKIQPGFVDQ